MVALLAALLTSAAQLPLLPSPIAVDRRFAPVELSLAFRLGEEHRSQLRVIFEGEGGGGEAARERCVLALDFDPLDGARFTFSRALGAGAPLQATLTNVPEPKGLDYKVRLLLHAGRGLEAMLPDGSPILAATTPTSGALTISFESEGEVLGLTASAPVKLGDAALAASLEAGARAGRKAEVDAPSAADATWSSLRSFVASGEVPPLLHVEPFDRVEVPEGVVERFELELAESERVPVLLLTPPKPDGSAALVIAGGAQGKASPAALAQIAALAARGTRVIAFDLLGGGERRELQPFDSLADPELELVGDSAARHAVTELRQIVAWAKERIEGSPDLEVRVDADAHTTLIRAGTQLIESAIERTELPAASRELAAAATFTEELVRRRYDSWLLELALEKRETLRMPSPTVRGELFRKLEFQWLAAPAPHETQHCWIPGYPIRDTDAPGLLVVTLCASDFGWISALHVAAETRSPSPGEGLVAVEDGPVLELDDALRHRTVALASHVESLTRSHVGTKKIRLLGEGSCGVVMLLAATLHPEHVESLTVFHAIPSFELLLLRPRDAVRAPAELGVLSQGMPAELFVPGALSRFELEDCVVELRKHGVAVEWKEPVDALRRPLSRHDRLAMWPRVRHAEQAR